MDGCKLASDSGKLLSRHLVPMDAVAHYSVVQKEWGYRWLKNDGEINALDKTTSFRHHSLMMNSVEQGT